VTAVLMIGQATLLFFGVLGITTLVGYAPVALFAPDTDGTESDAGWSLLLVPAVGWAVIAGALQSLGGALVAPAALALTLALGGAASLAVAWRGRERLREQVRRQGVALAVTLGGGLVTTLALLAFVFHAGVFAFDGAGTDALWLYGHTAQYLETHTVPFAAPTTAFVQGPADLARQTLDIHRSLYPALTQMDAALAGLLHLPVYALIEPLDAACLALVLPGLYVLCTQGLGLTRQAAFVALALYAAHPLGFWAMGMDFVQQLRAGVLVPAALALVLIALRGGDVRLAALAGLTAAPVLAVYFPAFAVLALGTAAALVVALIGAVRAGRFASVTRASGVLMGVGSVVGAPGMYVLFVANGPQVWLSNLRDTHAGAGITRFLPVRYVVGVSPLADPLKLGPPSPLAGAQWWPLGSVALLAVGALVLLGIVTLMWRGQWAAVAAFLAMGAYLAYLRFGAAYPYGFTRTACYVVPFSCVLVATGAVEFPRLLAEWAGRRGKPGARYPALAAAALCALALVAVLGSEGASSAFTEQAYIATGPRYFAPQYLSLNALPTMISTGATVYMMNEGDTTAIKKQMLAAYFLPGRRVTIAHHPFIPRTPVTEERTVVAGFAPYDYLLLPAPLVPDLSGDFALRWRDEATGLSLYAREGPHAFFVHRPTAPMATRTAQSALRQVAAHGVSLDVNSATDALAQLVRVYYGRADLQARFGGPDALDLPALTRWAATEGATTDRDHDRLAPYVAPFTALGQTPPLTITFYPDAE